MEIAHIPVNPLNGILFCHKNEPSVDTCRTLDEPWRHAQWHKPAIKGHALCDAFDLKYSNWQISRDRKQIRSYPGNGERKGWVITVMGTGCSFG